MKFLLKHNRILSIILLVIMGITLFTAPSLSHQAQLHGKIAPPDSMTSQKYKKLLKKSNMPYNTMVAVVSLNHRLTTTDQKALDTYAKKIEKVNHIKKVITPSMNKDAYNQLVSEDKKFVMLPIQYDSENTKKIAKEIKDINQSIGDIRLTNHDLIMDDINVSTDKGLHVTEIVTVVLILIILIIVFKSIITPFIPLFVVGISYLFSSAILAILVKYFNFPVSVYIQPFLVALLFGVGTDYCILLLTRFKEELNNTRDKKEAIEITFIQGGKTILVCALAIVAGFSALFFVKFDLFKSAVGIGIGVIILMFIIYTILPLVLYTLGEKAFWPTRKSNAHHENKLWGRLGMFTQRHSFFTIMLISLLCILIVVLIPRQITYDNTNEISDSYDSVKALNIIKAEFDTGDVFPVQIAIKRNNSSIDGETLSEIERLSQSIAKIDGVKNVNTITRPAGKPVDEFKVNYQLGMMSKRIEKMKNGTIEVNNGLNNINKQIEPLKDSNQVTAMMQQSTTNPTKSILNVTAKATQLSNALTKIEKGNQQILSGEQQLQTRLKEMSKSRQINTAGMYIDETMLKNKQVQTAIKQYRSDDEDVILINVSLSNNPYHKKTFSTLKEIKQIVKTQINDTKFEDSTIEYGGITSQNNDLNDTINHDMLKAIILMSCFILVILIIFTKSLIMPIYMIGSIIVTYYVSMSIANVIYSDILKSNGILLVVPFFSLVTLMSLGVDYALFLVTRFNQEVAHQNLLDALIKSMRKMGSVIITACIIIIGTFSALYTSGSETLMQIATVLIIGLIVYNTLMLPLMIPALINTFGNGNWWPTHKKHL